MYASTSFTSPLIHELLLEFHSRRLLLHTTPSFNQSPSSSPNPPNSPQNSSPQSSYLGDGTFDANVVMVLSVLLCALICSLGLNSIIRCALKCSSLVVSTNNSDSNNNHHTPSSRVVNTGIKKKALKTFTTLSYSNEFNLPSLDSECVICLSDFAIGDRLRILPKCNHGFHIKCIDKWLSSHSSCPKCRHCLMETCHKIIGATTSSTSSQLPETILTIAPLDPERLVRNYRESN
ncbi:hypothetical protein HN51_032201 [Arachis hypogaea]|uniref:RING-type E3 ubiquitin transferase n=2 Tax=Arachis TaxID=3817 RepID=A0A445B5D6_ARAHY|nr:RING-H2 finger protein ATL78 [Arachis duranensis]XP_025623485.1 RING-H2 finger protein ATL78 [Arachis hypogaea]XP_057739142.1 RING-H2 finger protein ATL78-like [Arachis stenosperma]QHO16500.1 RING-H2 finger protein [Arachis hypogaea]RYR33878.1 hypothetical protein Ahy_A10g048548 [Arachis hypogaea]